MKGKRSFSKSLSGFRSEFLVFVLAAAVYLPGLSRGGLWDPWETHYAEVARQILERGDWLTMHWAKNSNRCKWTKQGEVFYSKPPLPFWAMAVSFMVFGVNDFAARLPFVLAGALGLAFFFFVVRTLWDTKKAALSVLVLASSPLYSMLCRQAMLDIMFVAFLTGSLGSFMLWEFHEPRKARYLYGFYLFSGLAVMAKGLPGVALPLAAVGMYVLITGRWEVLARMRPITGPAVFFLVAGPWHLYMLLGRDGARWYREYILFHHFTRGAKVLQGAGSGGLGYYAEVLWSTFFPWFAFLPVAAAVLLVGNVRRRAPETGRDTFLDGLAGALLPFGLSVSERQETAGETERHGQGALVLAVCWVVVWFSVITWSRTKFNHYLFPALPPMALLVAAYLWELPGRLQGRAEKVLVFSILVLVVLAVREIFWSPAVWAYDITYDYTRQPLEKLATVARLGWPLPVLLVTSTTGVFLVAITRARRTGIGITTVSAVLLALWLAHGYMPFVAPAMGQAEAWQAFQEQKRPGDRVFNYRMIWRGEMWYSRDSAACVKNRTDLRKVLEKPGRVFFITNKDGNKHNQLKREYRALTGRSLKVVNKKTDNYIMFMHDGPALEPKPIRPPLGSVTKEAPKDIEEVHAHLGKGGGQVELVGYRLSQRPLTKGTYMDLTLYWRVLAKLDRDLQVFVHMDKPGERCFVSDTTPVRGEYPTTAWKEGEVVVDRHSFRLPKDCLDPEVSLYVGLFDDKGRLRVKEKQLTDSNDRILLRTLDLE